MERIASSAGFGNSTVTIFYDDETLLLTRCETAGVVEGRVIKAVATPEVGDPWSHEFVADESVPVDGDIARAGASFQFSEV